MLYTLDNKKLTCLFIMTTQPNAILIKNEKGYIEADFDLETNTYIIEGLEVKETKKGFGTELLNIVKEEAKRFGASIKLTAFVDDEDKIDFEGLCNFYLKNGFNLLYKGSNEAEFAL